MAEERAAAFTRRSIKTSAKLEGLKLAVSMMDLTTLEGNDTPGKIAFLSRKAMQPLDPRYQVSSCVVVCVYPNLVRIARTFLGHSNVKVASVATAFPAGLIPAKLKLREVRSAVRDGADEIDMVINRANFLAGEYERVFDEIAATREACGAARLKVILETGELQTYDNVRLASEVAMRAGADFIKTSTGKISPAATMRYPHATGKSGRRQLPKCRLFFAALTYAATKTNPADDPYPERRAWRTGDCQTRSKSRLR